MRSSRLLQPLISHPDYMLDKAMTKARNKRMEEWEPEAKAVSARGKRWAGNRRWKVAASPGKIIIYTALSRCEIELLYHAAVAAGGILVLRRVARFLTGLEVSMEGPSPGSSVADMRQRFVQASPPTIGYTYQFFCNDRALSDDDLLDGTVVYGATVVPSELQFSKVVERKRELQTNDLYVGALASDCKCKVTLQPLPPDIVNEHGFLRADAAATCSDGHLGNLERLAWLTSPDIGWTSMGQQWWSRFRQDHYWGRTLTAVSASDRNALGSLFEGQAAQSASHAFLPFDRVIVSAGYVLTASKMPTCPTLRADKEVVLAVVIENGNALRCVVDTLRADKEVVLAAVAHDGGADDDRIEYWSGLINSSKPEAPVGSSDARRFTQRSLQFQRRPIYPADAPNRCPKLAGAKLPRSKGKSWCRCGRK